MQNIHKKINGYKEKLQKHGLDDPRLLGLLLVALIGLSVIWSGIGIVQENYSLQQKVTLIEEENRVLELQNSNKQLQNEYYKTPEFAELKARRVNGVASPGEQVYIISEETALAALKTPDATSENTPATPNTQKPAYQKNFEAWMDFFFGG